MRLKPLVATVTGLLISGGAFLATGTAAQAATCTTSSPTGACGPYSDPNVFTSSNGADLVVQNDFSAITQTLTSNGDSNWTVAASTVGQSDQTSVKSYPATQVTYTLANGNPDPSSDFGTTLTSQYANVVPTGANQDYEYAVDDWLADPAKPSWTNDLEIMIWTDVNHQVPAGSPTGQTYVDPSGQSWQVWTAGGATTVSPDSTISFVRGSIANPANADTGTIDRMGFYKYLQNQGMLSATYGIDQLNYGLEICSTGGATRTYGISNYTIVPNGQQQQSAPVVSTNAASGVTQTAATLNGAVNPEGQAATYQFDYGTTTSYGTSVPVPAGSAGSGSAAVNETANLTGLTASTTYHYRIEATNATGTTFGSDQTFTTSASGGGTSVAYDTSAGKRVANASSESWTHTVGTGSNRVLLVEATVGVSNDVNCTQTVKDGTTTLTKLGVVHTNGQSAGYMDVWGLVNPPSGANTLTFTVSGCSGGTPSALTAGSESYTGVNQATPWGTLGTATGFTATPAITQAATSSSDMVAAFAADGSSITSVIAPATSRFLENQNSSSGAGNSAGASQVSSGSGMTVSWNGSASDWWGTAITQLNHA